MEQFDRFAHLQRFIEAAKEASQLGYTGHNAAQTIRRHHLRVQKHRLMPHLLYLEDQFSLLRGSIEHGDKVGEDTALKYILGRCQQLGAEDRKWVWYLLPDRDIPGNLRFVREHYFPANAAAAGPNR